MLVLTAAVIVVGVLCLVDLLLTFGVIRRLREHTTTLEGLANRGSAGDSAGHSLIAPPGSAVGEFAARTVDGEPVTRDLLGDAVVVFVSPDCPSCLRQLPKLAKWAAKQDRGRTLVVIEGGLTDSADLVEMLSPVARVIVETTADLPVMTAFGVTAFPASCVVSDGKLISTAAEFTGLPELAQV